MTLASFFFKCDILSYHCSLNFRDKKFLIRLMCILFSRVRGTSAGQVKHWKGIRKKDVWGKDVPQVIWMNVILNGHLGWLGR